MGLSITLKNGAIHNYPNAKLDKDFFSKWLSGDKGPFAYLEAENKCVIYRISEIATIELGKEKE